MNMISRFLVIYIYMVRGKDIFIVSKPINTIYQLVGLSKPNGVTFLTCYFPIISTTSGARKFIRRSSSCSIYAIKMNSFRRTLESLERFFDRVTASHKRTLDLKCSSVSRDFLRKSLSK